MITLSPTDVRTLAVPAQLASPLLAADLLELADRMEQVPEGTPLLMPDFKSRHGISLEQMVAVYEYVVGTDD